MPDPQQMDPNVHVANPMPKRVKHEGGDYHCTADRPYDPAKTARTMRTVWHESKWTAGRGVCIHCGRTFHG